MAVIERKGTVISTVACDVVANIATIEAVCLDGYSWGGFSLPASLASNTTLVPYVSPTETGTYRIAQSFDSSDGTYADISMGITASRWQPLHPDLFTGGWLKLITNTAALSIDVVLKT